jgi:hydroxymethylglutaryl-CoA synthase
MSTIIAREYHFPRYRLPTGAVRDQWGGGANGVKAKSVQAVDDDAVTLGLRAAKGVLDGRTDVDTLVFATTSGDYQYGTATPTMCEALGLPADVYTVTVTESARAGTAALRVANDSVDSGAETALVVAAEAPQPEPGTDREKTAGAGAAAALVEAGGSGFTQVSQATNTRNVLEEWQASNNATRHRADDRYGRDLGYVAGIENAVETVLDETEWTPDQVDALALQQPNPKFVSRVSRTLGLDDATVAPSLATQHGNLGSASVLATLARTEAAEGDRIVVASYGSGVADAIAYEATEAVDSRPAPDADDLTELEYVEYLHATESLRGSA